MRQCKWKSLVACLTALAGASLLSSGCGLNEWVQNGFKVGPNYNPPEAPVASEWIDYKDGRVTSAPRT